MMQRGLSSRFGDRLRGLQDLLQQLRSRKQQELEKHDLGSILDDIREKLDNVIRTEREGIERRLKEGRQDLEKSKAEGKEGEGGEELLKMLENAASKKQSFLDSLPKQLGGAIKALSDYEFMDAEAKRQFDELMDMLKQKAMEPYFRQLSEGLKSLTPEDIARMKEMLARLNEMLEEKMRGGQPDFDKFMEQFGQYFGPQPPSSL
jgi:uncharacterized protein with von Willebrand factor type A (vWA) domain